MRLHERWMRGLAAVALSGALAAPAAAGVAWTWTTQDGSKAYTDDRERIPERYRASAKRIETGSLTSYDHLSPSQVTDPIEQRVAELQARAERLREMADRAATEQAAERGYVVPGDGLGHAAVGIPSATYEATVTVDGSTFRVPAQRGEGPLVVEEKRVIPRGKSRKQPATIVRQGDDVLMIVYGSESAERNLSDTLREDELIKRSDDE